MLDYFRTRFGPTGTQFATLDDPVKEAFTVDLLNLYAEWNQAPDDTVLIPGGYLEVVATTS